MILGRSTREVVKSGEPFYETASIPVLFADGDSSGGTCQLRLYRYGDIISVRVTVSTFFTRDTGDVTTTLNAFPPSFRPSLGKVCATLVISDNTATNGRVTVLPSGFVLIQQGNGSTVTGICGLSTGSGFFYNR